MPKLVCDVEGCDEEISEGTGSKGGLPICKRCRATQYYWRRKGAKAVQARRASLVFWEQRLDYLSPHIARMVSAAKDRVEKARKGAESRVH